MITDEEREDAVQKIAQAIEADIRDRRGLRQAFESIDEDIQREIREAWRALVRQHLTFFRETP